ncbi:hypothetical protein A5893_08045 [Pedobacter psychrophilus]|uniref:Antitermination protein NusB n=1 Tax=Pedobacter psychrophilus TaxID=1826909 RepID=A0A179DFU2_9SPHI|nr:YdeI/OmpD-associated family protein [Pedobacter psychrophilus]OAQ39925.1 hypothetical protein A5893_08045 [Pedobacter psychrophilus]
MIQFATIIHQFEKMGEKTGWTYVEVPFDISQQIKKDCKVSYRVKGKIDETEIYGIAVLPMGEGNFIIALKKELQKKIGKRKGALVNIQIEEDKNFKIEMPDDLEYCLDDAIGAAQQFLSMPKSHQNYYINWINSAKTDPTRVKRLSQTVNAMVMKMDYGEMMRHNKKDK